MAKYTHDIIIIGAGSAGLTTTSGCAQLGLKTALIEKTHMGGDCLHYGCVPSKTLIKSAGIYHDMKNLSQYGLPDIEKLPPVDIAKVMDRVQTVIKSIEHHDSVERFEGLGAEVYLESPEFVSPHEIKLASGKVLSAKNIVLATGSAPRIVPIPGLKEAGYITNKDVFSMTTMPENLIVIGGGPIGVEMSQSFARLGANVTLVDMALHVLPREDEDMATCIQNRMTDDGVTLVLQAAIKRVEIKDGKKAVIYEKEGKEHSVTGDEILLAIGRRGNTGDLKLENAGIEVERSFIKVKPTLQTTGQKHIYAIGDVNGSYLFTHVAGSEGSLVVRKIVFKLPGSMNYNAVPWCTYTEPELASIGYNEKRAKEAGIPYKIAYSSFEDIDRAWAEGATRGKIKILLGKNDRIIGVQIAGPHAGELILPALFSYGKKYKIMDIISPMFPYPTLGEIYKKAASSIMSPKIFNPKVRKMLKFFFGYRGRE